MVQNFGQIDFPLIIFDSFVVPDNFRNVMMFLMVIRLHITKRDTSIPNKSRPSEATTLARTLKHIFYKSVDQLKYCIWSRKKCVVGCVSLCT